MKTLSILFAGQTVVVRLLDDSTVIVFVRALPQRFLGHVIECCEFKHRLIELCTYFQTKSAETEAANDAFPDITPPAGYTAVPSGWCDNLTDEGVEVLYHLAQKLNFPRAADWAKGQIAAKKLVAPIQQAAIEQVMPLVQQVMSPLLKRLAALSPSMPSAPSSSAPAAKNS